jgi:prepilin-type N-terminal cleavage/methylation domain-containing protein
MLTEVNRRLRARTQRGVTLIEVLIVMILTGIIVVPLAGTFYTMVTSSNETNQRLVDNAAVQRITEAWTKDVQSVDPSGYYNPPAPLPGSVHSGSPRCRRARDNQRPGQSPEPGRLPRSRRPRHRGRTGPRHLQLGSAGRPDSQVGQLGAARRPDRSSADPSLLRWRGPAS